MNRKWIFLRGLARSSVHWGPFLEVFKNEFPDDQVELLDLAGNGTESMRKSFLQIEDSVEDLRIRSQILRKGQKVSLLTISMGSMVGVAWAEKYPKDIENLFLINTSDRKRGHFYERLQLSSMPQFLKILFYPLSPVEKERLILEIVAPDGPDLGRWARDFAKAPFTSKENIFRQLVSAARFAFPTNKPLVPVTLLSSHKDKMVDPSCTARLAMGWKVPHIEHPTGGHDLPFSNPEWLCQQIKLIFLRN